jgi:hypothetical protein
VPANLPDFMKSGVLGPRSSALETLDADGVDEISVRAVARRAGVYHSAPSNLRKRVQCFSRTLIAFDLWSRSATSHTRGLTATPPHLGRSFSESRNCPSLFRLF